MPLVLILALAGSLIIAILLERQGSASLSVRRQLDAYQFHHVSGGMREMIARWMKLARGPIESNLDDDGRAFMLQLPGGYSVDVYMEDGQGGALTDTSQLVGRRRQIAEYMRAYVETFGDPDEFDVSLRPAGPAVISVASAPRIVLEALASACVEPDQVQQVVDTLLAIAAQHAEPGYVHSSSPQISLADLRIDSVARQEIESMITTSPSIFRIICVERAPGGRANWRAGGLMDVASTRSVAAYDQGGPFLTWEDLPPEGTRSR